MPRGAASRKRARPSSSGAAPAPPASKKSPVVFNEGDFFLGLIDYHADWKKDTAASTSNYHAFIPTEHVLQRPEDFQALINNPLVAKQLEDMKEAGVDPTTHTFTFTDTFVLCGDTLFDVGSFRIINFEERRLLLIWPLEEKKAPTFDLSTFSTNLQKLKYVDAPTKKLITSLAEGVKTISESQSSSKELVKTVDELKKSLECYNEFLVPNMVEEAREVMNLKLRAQRNVLKGEIRGLKKEMAWMKKVMKEKLGVTMEEEPEEPEAREEPEEPELEEPEPEEPEDAAPLNRYIKVEPVDEFEN